MRWRDKPTFPVATSDGTYGCCKCGTYFHIWEGEKLACRHCRTALPLVYCQPLPATTRAQTPPAQQSNDAQLSP